MGSKTVKHCWIGERLSAVAIVFCSSDVVIWKSGSWTGEYCWIDDGWNKYDEKHNYSIEDITLRVSNMHFI